MPKNNDNQICCSFCGKSQDEVTRLVEGPGVYICDNCISFCSSLLYSLNLSLTIIYIVLSFFIADAPLNDRTNKYSRQHCMLRSVRSFMPSPAELQFINDATS